MFRKSLPGAMCCAVCLTLLAGAIVTAVSPGPDNTSMLTAREMANITGTACNTCHELTGGEDHDECRYYLDNECTFREDCDSSDNRYHDNWKKTCSIVGAQNNKKCSENTVSCFTPTNMVSNGNGPDQVCDTTEPPGVDWSQWDGWWFRCVDSEGQTCTKCKWGTPAGATTFTDFDSCVPI